MTGARTDTSRNDWRWALRLANRGYGRTAIAAALSKKPSGRRDAGSLKYMRLLDERGRDAADLYATRTAERAIQWVHDNPAIRTPTEATLRLLEIEAAAEALPWAVYGGPGVRRGLEAAFLVADRTRRVNFGLALREWAELAGQDFEAIRRHRDVLIDLDWMKRNTDDRPGRTARFALRIPRHIQLHMGGWNVGVSADRGWVGHDAFRPEGLGDAGWYVLHELSGPMSLSSLSGQTGYGPYELEDQVSLLMRHGLIVGQDPVGRAEDGLLDLLDRAAESFGTAGALDDDRAAHEAERRAFRARPKRLDVNVAAVLV